MADINTSDYDNLLEQREDGAARIRLGFRQVDRFSPGMGERLVAARGAGFTHVRAPAQRAGLPSRR